VIGFDALELIVEFHIETRYILYEFRDRGIHLPHLLYVPFGQDTLVGDIQRDEREGHPGVVDNVRSVRVHIGVELRQGGGVALMADRAAHDDHFPDRLDEARLLPDGQGDIRQRADRHQGDFSRGGHDLLDQKIASMLDDRPGGRLREHRVPKAGVTMRLRRKQRWLDERQLTSPGNRNMTGICQLQDREGVDRCLFNGAISMHDAQALQGKLRGRQGEQDGAGVVYAGVGVKEDSFWHVSPGWRGSMIPCAGGTAR